MRNLISLHYKKGFKSDKNFHPQVNLSTKLHFRGQIDLQVTIFISSGHEIKKN